MTGIGGVVVHRYPIGGRTGIHATARIITPMVESPHGDPMAGLEPRVISTISAVHGRESAAQPRVTMPGPATAGPPHTVGPIIPRQEPAWLAAVEPFKMFIAGIMRMERAAHFTIRIQESRAREAKSTGATRTQEIKARLAGELFITPTREMRLILAASKERTAASST